MVDEVESDDISKSGDANAESENKVQRVRSSRRELIRYSGPLSLGQLCVMNSVLNTILCSIGSQWRERRSGVTLSNREAIKITLAARFFHNLKFMGENVCLVVHTFLIVMLCLYSVNAACNNVTEYECANGNCIDIDYVNNTINDCQDNSDEGPIIECPDKLIKGSYAGQMKCSDGKGCALLDFINDGSADCVDESDELKYIGGPCNEPGVVLPQDNFDCSVWMLYAECVTLNAVDYTCQCQSGTYANADQLNCTKRVLHDPCTVDADCEDAVTHSECDDVNNVCVCDLGYIEDTVANNLICRLLQLNDNCSSDAACQYSISHSECDSTTETCVCVEGYIQDGDSCRLRGLGDPCTTNEDCTTGTANSECDTTSNSCTCIYHYVISEDNTQCDQRIIGSDCSDKDQCTQYVDNSVCDGTCVCDDGYYSNGDSSCLDRRLGDECSATADCGLVAFSDCSDGVCACGDGYQQSGSACEPEPSIDPNAGAQTATEAPECGFVCSNGWVFGVVGLVVVGAVVAAVVVVVLKKKAIAAAAVKPK